jgi:DNA-binding transcriptional ArsR family regulator
MLTASLPLGGSTATREADDLMWRALANPVRRRLLDELGHGPRTTGALAEVVPALSRFAVMQHLGVLESAGLVVVRRRGRHRFNHLNAAPLRRWYERWVLPLADRAAADVVALHRHLEQSGGIDMDEHETVRTIRIENELRFSASAERVFAALTEDSLSWFPHTYGGERARSIVLEPRVGGLHYEDWGDGAGHLYGQVTAYDPPTRFATRGALMPGVILDSEYTVKPSGDDVVLQASKVIVGPLSDEQAGAIRRYGDLSAFEAALRQSIEGPKAEGSAA